MDYRERCYQSYNLQWSQLYASSKKEYEQYAKLSRRRYRQVLPATKSARILDVACGAGHFLYFLNKEGYCDAHGIDISSDQLTIARSMGVSNVEQADVFAYLPDHKAEYDLIIANDILEHFTREEAFTFLDMLFASLKPGGKVLIKTINGDALFASAAVYIDFTHQLAYTPVSFSHILRVVGFSAVTISGEAPIIHNVRSLLRSCLWKVIKIILRSYLFIERGAGSKRTVVLESVICAIGEKPSR